MSPTVRIEIDGDEELRSAFLAVRSELKQGVKQDLKEAAHKHGVPAARRLSPSSRIDSLIRAGATITTAHIEVPLKRGVWPGPKGRNVPALLEFGGTIRGVLEPKSAKAIRTPYGPRARVKRARRYRARKYLQTAVTTTLPAVVADAERAIEHRFERRRVDVT